MTKNLDFGECLPKENFLKKRIRPLNFLVFGLLTAILLGSILLWLPITHKENVSVSYMNALFTATSASTVTGLVAVDTQTTYNFLGQLIILVLINCGGLGYMTVITFFFLSTKSWTLPYAEFAKESLNLPSIGNVLRAAKKVFMVIIGFETIGIILLTILWMKEYPFLKSLWYGIFHAMSAFNNAGFDLMGGKSLTGYSSHFFLNLIIIALIFFGGIGFLVISDILTFKKLNKKLSLHTKLVLSTSIILIVLGAVGFYTLERTNVLQDYPEGEKWIASFFQSVSSRTAGFNTVDISLITLPSILLLCLLMFIGASPGSTGAGIKTSTFAVIMLWFVSAVRNRNNPEAFERRINRALLRKSLLIFFSASAAIFLFVFTLSIAENLPLHKILFETISAFGTVGLSTGITSSLTAFSKAALCIMMFIGRMTPLALIMLISKKTKCEVKLVEEDVIVG